MKYGREAAGEHVGSVYDITTCEDVASHFYNLERVHVVGIHNICGQISASLAVGVVFVPMTVPLMNMRACTTCVHG